MESKNPTLSEAIQRIVGKPLLSVNFVEDYVQLVWEDSFFTAYTMPNVHRHGIEYGPEHPEYREEMSSLEGVIVKGVSVSLGEKVEFIFSSACFLTVSLRDDDYVGPEAIQFGIGRGGGQLWVV